MTARVGSGEVVFIPEPGGHVCRAPESGLFRLGTRWRCDCGRLWELVTQAVSRREVWDLQVDWAPPR